MRSWIFHSLLFFFSYHQKYLLRQQPTLLRSLGLNSVELLNSSVAARLNGYVGGYGALKDFEAEVDELKISEAQADMVRKIISNKRFWIVSHFLTVKKQNQFMQDSFSKL